MRCQRSAAKLLFGYDNLAAVCREYSNRSLVQCSEAHLRNASGEERDAGAARALRGKCAPELRKKEFALDARHQLFAAGQSKQIKQPDARARVCSPER
jgi:hypothetical protein